jgi:hypothetical protein
VVVKEQYNLTFFVYNVVVIDFVRHMTLGKDQQMNVAEK